MALIDSNDKLVLQANGYGANSKAIFFDASGDYLTAPDHADWDFGTGDFTLEAWVKFKATGAADYFFIDVHGTNTVQLYYEPAPTPYMRISIGGTLYDYAFTAVANKWYHVAGVRSGSNVRMFVNGKLLGTQSNSTNITSNSGVRVGMRNDGLYPMDGWMKYVRISNTARYSTDFVPSVSGLTSDSNTKLLLKAEESLHATTFTDTGNTGHTITTNGNCVLQLQSHFCEGLFRDTETTPKIPITDIGDSKVLSYKFNKSAMFFPGTGSASGSEPRINLADHADWDFGTGDFTLETWVMFRSIGANNMLFSRNNGSASDGYEGNITSSAVTFVISGSTVNNHSFAWQTFVWYHVAWVRSGTTTYIFVNGKSLGTGTNSANLSGTSPLYIGSNPSNNWGLDGWMKEFRISNSARYTADFTPSDAQFSSDSNTKLLLHGDTPATAPLSPCIKFDGTGDYLTLADHADWAFGTGDFTIETWFRGGTVTGTNIYDGRPVATNGAYPTIYLTASTVRYFTGGADRITGSTTLVANRWYHLAVSRTGTSTKMFLDGVQEGSTYSDSTNYISSATSIKIGADSSVGSNFNGWMKQFRISNSARYTADFTPSQTPFTADSNTKLLILATENNGVTTFIDSETTPKTITTNGNCVISYEEDYRNTIFKDDGNTGHKPYGDSGYLEKIDFIAPFGEGGLYFDGTGDYLTVADSADWNFGSGDFTWECWVKFFSVSGERAFFSQGSSGATYCRFAFDSSNVLQFNADNTIFTYASKFNVSFTPQLNLWYHVALTRSGSTFRILVNGTSLGTNTDADSYPDYSGDFAVGAIWDNSAASAFFSGFIENARISKGVARYTATFNPDTSDISGGRRKAFFKAALV